MFKSILDELISAEEAAMGDIMNRRRAILSRAVPLIRSLNGKATLQHLLARPQGIWPQRVLGTEGRVIKFGTAGRYDWNATDEWTGDLHGSAEVQDRLIELMPSEFMPGYERRPSNYTIHAGLAAAWMAMLNALDELPEIE